MVREYDPERYWYDADDDGNLYDPDVPSAPPPSPSSSSPVHDVDIDVASMLDGLKRAGIIGAPAPAPKKQDEVYYYVHRPQQQLQAVDGGPGPARRPPRPMKRLAPYDVSAATMTTTEEASKGPRDPRRR